MNITQKPQRKQNKKLTVVLIVILVVLLAIGAVVYYKKKNNHEAKTTSTSKTAQNDYNDGKERPTNGGSTGTSQGGATDNKGSEQKPTPSESSISSENGAITVLGLAKDATLTDGFNLHGTANGVAVVQFRIIDENVGVIAQGPLSVVDGSFSGTLHFKAQSSTGRVDVFSFDSAGSEINNIEIPVRFK